MHDAELEYIDKGCFFVISLLLILTIAKHKCVCPHFKPQNTVSWAQLCLYASARALLVSLACK